MRMIKTHLLTLHAKWPYKRQTPSESMTWKNTQFFLNDLKTDADFMVVYDEPDGSFLTHIPKERRILFISEPPSIKEYKKTYLEQFGIVCTPQKIIGLNNHTKQIIGQLCLPWHYGVAHSHRFSEYETYDSLSSMQVPKKNNKISTMISSKVMNNHHRQRIHTTQFLKQELGDEFHLLGRGYNEIDDKAEGIAPYAFHLVCENNDVPHFWTEKLADAYLGWSFPIFSGCDNIKEYFPENSFVQVDLSKPEKVLQQIRDILDTPNFYESRQSFIEKARNLILNDYNLFAVVNNIIENYEGDSDYMLNSAEKIEPQTPRYNLMEKFVRGILKRGLKVINRLKNMHYHLPIYFKIANRNINFFTDYHDNLGQVAHTRGYYGQRGQDYFLDQKIFNGRPTGFYLDIGANDPKELSNTLYFEEQGWTGLAFEPQERFRNKWKTERKTPCLEYLLGATEGEEVTFVEYDTNEWQNALSGVEGFALEEGKNIENVASKRMRLTKRALGNILKEQGVTHVDFMSLDVEGYEYEVLQGINFEEVRIDVIVVENDRTHMGDQFLRTYIKSKGYNHVARLSGDDVFTRIGADL